MEQLWGIVLITAIAGVGGTGLGGLIGALVRRDSSKQVSLLLSFAAGVMLSVVCFDLIDSALFPGGVADPSHLAICILSIAFGFGVVWLLNILIDRATNHELPHQDDDHPRTADDLDELIHSDHYERHKASNDQLFLAGVIMAAAIALHNLPEGMIIGAAYASPLSVNLWSGSGLIMAVIIGMHNVPEGMAVSVPLIAGGMKKGRAVFCTAMSGAPTILGALLGYWLGTMGQLWHTLALCFASGAMLYVVFGELLPEAILMWRSKLPAAAVLAGMLCGICLLFI